MISYMDQMSAEMGCARDMNHRLSEWRLGSQYLLCRFWSNSAHDKLTGKAQESDKYRGKF